jgi:hypothetical protein
MNRTALALTALMIAACGGGAEEISVVPVDASDEQTGADAGESGETDGSDLDLPASVVGFDRVCATGIGFGDAAEYASENPGPHPVAPFQRSDPDDPFATDIRSLPSGWSVDPAAGVAAVELVSCVDVAERRPTGIVCDLEGDDGSTSSLELVDMTFSLTVHSANSGEVIGETTLEAVDETCPSFTFVDDGQTEYVNLLTENQIVNALKPFVSPDGAGGDPTELPQFDAELSRVCETQIGFGGATALSNGPGPRPVILFRENNGIFIESSADLPAGWRIDADLDFDDNSELQPLEMIACSAITSQTPNGIACDLEGDDGSITTLALVDVTYELTVYEATSAEVIGTSVIEAASERCPTIVLVDQGQTDYLNTPSADQFIVALEPFVLPS